MHLPVVCLLSASREREDGNCCLMQENGREGAKSLGSNSQSFSFRFLAGVHAVRKEEEEVEEEVHHHQQHHHRRDDDREEGQADCWCRQAALLLSHSCTQTDGQTDSASQSVLSLCSCHSSCHPLQQQHRHVHRCIRVVPTTVL